MQPTNDPPPPSTTEPDAPQAPPTATTTVAGHSAASRIAMGILLTFVAMLLAVVILTPIALSSQDLINWAGAPTGLDLPRPWPVLVLALVPTRHRPP